MKKTRISLQVDHEDGQTSSILVPSQFITPQVSDTADRLLLQVRDARRPPDEAGDAPRDPPPRPALSALTMNLPPYECWSRRHKIAAVISTMMTNLLYYDRKEDETLFVGGIEDAILAGDVSVDEIVDFVRDDLERAVDSRKKETP